MLRASCRHLDLTGELRGISDMLVDTGLDGSAEILAAVDAAVLRDSFEIDDARAALVDRLGEPAAVRVFAVAGNFEMMNRLLDGQGVQPPEQAQAIAPAVGVPYEPHH